MDHDLGGEGSTQVITASADTREGDRIPSPVLLRLAVGLGLWALVITLARLIGGHVVPARVRWTAFPLYGEWMGVTGRGGDVIALIGGAALLGAVILLATEHLTWGRLLVTSWMASAGFMSMMAAVGPVEFGSQLDLSTGYRATLARIGPLSDFVSTFSRNVGHLPTHTAGHPPGPVVLLRWLDDLGLRSSAAQLFALIAIAAGTAPAIATVAREWGSENVARIALPFVVLAPTAVWASVTMDGVFASVSALRGSRSLPSGRHEAGRTRMVAALASGLVWSIALHLSYGLVALALVSTVAIALRRRFDVIGWSALGLVIGTIPWLVAGFWWWDGLTATRDRYHAGIGSQLRPYGFYSLLGNPALAAILIGPIVAAALLLPRSKDTWIVIGLGVASMVIADVSGLSKAEVERIWVPFAGWVTVAAASLPRRLRKPTLAAHACWAVALAATLDFVR